MKAACPVCTREISLTPKGGRFVKHKRDVGTGARTVEQASTCPGSGEEYAMPGSYAATSPGSYGTDDMVPPERPSEAAMRLSDAEDSEARPPADTGPGHYVTPEQLEQIRTLAPVSAMRPPALVQQDFALVPPWPTHQERTGQRWQPVSHKRGKQRAHGAR